MCGAAGYLLGTIVFRVVRHHRYPHWTDLGDCLGIVLGFVVVTVALDWLRRRYANRVQPSATIRLGL